MSRQAIFDGSQCLSDCQNIWVYIFVCSRVPERLNISVNTHDVRLAHCNRNSLRSNNLLASALHRVFIDLRYSWQPYTCFANIIYIPICYKDNHELLNRSGRPSLQSKVLYFLSDDNIRTTNNAVWWRCDGGNIMSLSDRCVNVKAYCT